MIWLHKPCLQAPCVHLFSYSLAHSALLLYFSWSSTTSGPDKYLPAATWRPAVYRLLLAIALSAVSLGWRASSSRFIPFLASSRLRYCTTWSTRVPVMPWLKFSPDGGMEDAGWLLLFLFADLRYLSVEFLDGARVASSSLVSRTFPKSSQVSPSSLFASYSFS